MTILEAVEKFKKRCENDPQLQEAVESLKKRQQKILELASKFPQINK